MTARLALLVAALVVVLAPLAAGQGAAPAPGPIGTVNYWQLNVRSAPGAWNRRVAVLSRGAALTRVAESGPWSQVRLPDGREGWVPSRYVTWQPVPATGAPLEGAPSDEALAGAAAAPPKPAAATLPPVAAAAGKPAAPDGALKGTRPDPAPRTQDGPGAALASGWRLLVYLVPVLVLVVLSIRGLRALQARVGTAPALPSLRAGLLGGLNLVNARASGGSSIRVLESVPLGTVGVHLLEVRGRELLIATAGANVTLLDTLPRTEGGEGGPFREQLRGAAADMAAAGGAGIGVEALVGSLDDRLRDAREAIVRSAARLRRNGEA
ncbi:MAG: flagellar biosynthetic protein FliO [Chthonomonadales bacterium]|nr:flagellar biosynthetic protein FliO [Chthonomonadales bacterium]